MQEAGIKGPLVKPRGMIYVENLIESYCKPFNGVVIEIYRRMGL
jgi:hypothetical protein